MATTRLDDRWLWLGFGIVSLLAVHGIRLVIRDLVTITKLDPYSLEPNNVTNKAVRPENGKICKLLILRGSTANSHQGLDISIKTLQTLAASTDPNIANSAISLLVSRVKRSQADMISIRKDLRSKDQETRRSATIAFDFLRQWPSGPEDIEPLEPGQLPFGLTFGTPGPNDGGTLWTPNDEEMRELRSLGMEEIGFNPWRIEEEEEEVVPSIENAVAGWTDVPRPRSPAANGDADEVERRRRRREAIVLHEGAGRLEERDIIRPVERFEDTRWS